MAAYSQFRYVPAGDTGLVVEIGDEIHPEINRKIRGLVLALEEENIQGVREYIPTYRSLLVQYDPVEILFNELIEKIKHVESQLEIAAIPEPRTVEIPVVYGGKFGPDLEFVARHNNLSQEKVIELHTGRDYLVYMLGFTPGFCYLGGMSDRLETHRLAEPRTCIPAGSVGIAGKQTGIYPIDSPGGWQIIGRTPLRLFDPHRDPAVLIAAGDYIRFSRIDEREYKAITKHEQSGKFIG
jgi:KipI family sensor histidine kinase inhibitor